MAVQLLIQQPGPLPIKTTFTAPSDAPLYLEINGSVWSEGANQMIGIAVEVDGNALGAATIFSNGASTHRAVAPAYFQLGLTEGQHTIELSAYGGVSDTNDHFTAVLHY